MPHRLPATVFGGAAAVIALVVLPACSTATAQPPAPPADLIQCLTEHGVPANAATPPEGHPGAGEPPPGGAPQAAPQAPPAPPGVDENTWAAAFAACAPR